MGSYDLEIIMTDDFLDICNDNEVILKAIKTIEENIKDGYKLNWKVSETGPFNTEGEEAKQHMFFKLKKNS